MILRRIALIGIPAVVLALGLSGAASAAGLVLNGDFTTSAGPAPGGQLGFNTTVTNWSVPVPNGPPLTNSYTFLFNPAAGTTSGTSADNGGVTSEYGNLQLWGPGNGSANGLTTAPPPDGGAFIGQDGAFQAPGALTQTVTGLTAGFFYNLTFDYAAAEQFGFTGASTSGWTVTLGGSGPQSVSTSIPSMGFSGWKTASMLFQADGTSDVLSFIAIGLPGSTVPPFALLDSVGLVQTTVPEPGTMSLLVFGLLGISVVRLRRRS